MVDDTALVSGSSRVDSGGMEPVVDARVECSDIDRDGVCDEDDRCEGFDDSLDRDGDAVPDFCDQCPDDPLKSEMGQCGCGVEDQDVDGDELADCRDACPIDGPSVAPTFGGVVTEEAMQILASQWMVVPGEGASIPSNPVPTVVASERLRLRVSYQVTGAPCLSCVKQGEVGIEGESQILGCVFDRVAAIDFRGVKDLDFVAPAVPGAYFIVANYGERLLCGGLPGTPDLNTWYEGAPAPGTQRIAAFCVRP